jgi:hypothetical protein
MRPMASPGTASVFGLTHIHCTPALLSLGFHPTRVPGAIRALTHSRRIVLQPVAVADLTRPALVHHSETRS